MSEELTRLVASVGDSRQIMEAWAEKIEKMAKDSQKESNAIKKRILQK